MRKSFSGSISWRQPRQSMRILKARKPCSWPARTCSSISSGCRRQPRPVLQYSGTVVRRAPPISVCTGSPVSLPSRSHSATSITPTTQPGSLIERSSRPSARVSQWRSTRRGSAPTSTGLMTLSRYASNTALLRPGTSAQPSTPAQVATRSRPLPMESGVQVMSLILMAATIPGSGRGERHSRRHRRSGGRSRQLLRETRDHRLPALDRDWLPVEIHGEQGPAQNLRVDALLLGSGDRRGQPP